MDSFLIGAAIVVALYIALRLLLRHYFPPGARLARVPAVAATADTACRI
jgi:hypothetical protein